jgi:hypothetical protein
MRCIAVIEAERPGVDSVILWDRDGQLVAFAYEDGRVSMTRPLQAQDLSGALDEIREAFQITAGQVSRITDWTDKALRTDPMAPRRQRW